MSVQGGPNKLFAAAFSYSPAPNVSYPEDPNDRLLIGQDADWVDLGLASPASNLRSPGQLPGQNTLLWFGNDNSTAVISIDAGADVGGDELWIFGITGVGGVYSPKAIHVEHSDDNSAWTTAKNWTGLTPATSANVQGATIAVADISAAGDHRYWRVTLTMGVASSATGICGIEIRDVDTYNPLIFATTTYSTAPNATWNDPPSSSLLLDGDANYQSGRRQRLTWEEYTQFENYSTGGWINVNTTSALTLTHDAGFPVGGRRFMLGGLAWTAAVGRRPTSFSLEHSDNNTDWTVVEADSGMTANPVTAQSPWLIDIDISGAGEHRYWRWVIDHDGDWYLLSNSHIVPTDGWFNASSEAAITHSAENATYPDYLIDTYRTGDTDWVDNDLSMVGWGYPGDQDTPEVGYTANTFAVDTGWPFTLDLGVARVIDHAISWGWQGNNNIPQPEAFLLEYSDNGSDWTTAVTDTGLTPIDTGGNRWMAWMETGEADPHRYWRFTPTMGGTANEWIFMSQIQLWAGPSAPIPPIPPADGGCCGGRRRCCRGRRAA